MKRRDFIKSSTLASGAFFVPQFIKALSGFDIAKTHKRLVVIQLNGGNDGLNTVVPYQNDIYFKSRKSLMLSKQDVFALTDELAFNKSLKFHQQLFQEGNLTVINSVGYPEPNRSHFRSSDIWHSGSRSDEYWSTGWVGRYLDAGNLHNFEAIEIDDSLSLMLKGDHVSGIAVRDPRKFYNIANQDFFKDMEQQATKHLNEHNLGYLYKNLINAEESAKYVFETSKTYDNRTDYPNNNFAKQLKSIATFINSGLSTSVYYASLGGFDTHAGQRQRQNKLLFVYDEAIKTFVEDLKRNNTFKNTVIMVFSEFGRRLSENAGMGTDHGAANNVFLIGDKLKTPQFYNSAPDLVNLDSIGDIVYQVDFRSIYATLLDDWLGVNNRNILGNDVKKIRLL